jgi:electron transfer flavoprotein alpha subunit
MSDYIVLVKQVPDVARITDNAFDPESGNLIRSRLASVINELDAQALAFANRLKEISGDTESRIICLTMGPPMAVEVLRYGLSRGADSAVLLTDRALGGADTWATANPLAHAIRRIKAEVLADTDDYFVVCGMQSVDGDTAQVPPQIAEELGIPCIPYATEAVFENGRFRFSCITAGGSQVVEALHMPAVITVARYEYPLFASLAATRRANQLTPIQWGAADVKPTAMGVSGSKTRVIRVFAPDKSRRQCRQVDSVQELAGHITENLMESNETGGHGPTGQAAYVLPARRASALDRSFEGTDKEVEEFKTLAARLAELNITHPAEITEEVKEQILDSKEIPFQRKTLDDMVAGLNHTATTYNGDVWVMAEHDEGRINPATFELAGKARELADSLAVKVGVILAGHGVRPQAAELIAAGADSVYSIEDPLLAQFDPWSYRKAVTDLFARHQPQILLFGATPQGRVLAPMVSYRLGCGLTADCTGLAIRDNSRKKQIGVLMQTRPALGGNVMATICSRNSSCQMATARPGVMKRLPADPRRQGRIIDHAVTITEADLSLRVLRIESSHGQVNFDCDVIISGGKGLQTRDTYDQLVTTLCSTAREEFQVSVEKGASRAAVEMGFAERSHQVGQTGTAVGPKLYIAIGISGAIQHMIGVNNAKIIIAINSDPAAPIFKQCDYYLVGRAEKVVPELTAALKRIKG